MNFIKMILFCYLCIMPELCLSQILDYPNVIDGGVINVSEIDTNGLYSNPTKQMIVHIKNISDKSIYFTGSKWDNLSSKNSGISNIKLTNIGRKYNNEESIEIIITYEVPYKNYQEFLGKTVSSKFYIFYRSLESLDYDSIAIDFNFKIFLNADIYFVKDIEPIIYLKQTSFNGNYKAFQIGKLINGSNKYLIIDSVQYKIEGKNTLNDFYFRGINKVITMPYTQLPNETVYPIVILNMLDKGITSFNFEVFCHFENEEEMKIIEGSYNFSFDYPPEKIRREGETNLSYNIMVKKGLIDSKKNSISLYNGTYMNWTIYKYEIESDYPEYVSNNFIELPVELKAYNDTISPPKTITIGNILISTPEVIKNRVLTKLYLRNELGEEQIESVLLSYIVDPELSIENDFRSNNLISPNPATDYITINIGPSEGWSVELYDMMGVLIQTTPSLRDTPPQDGNLRIEVSNLSPGVYFVKIGGRVERFVKM